MNNLVSTEAGLLEFLIKFTVAFLIDFWLILGSAQDFFGFNKQASVEVHPSITYHQLAMKRDPLS